MKQLKVITSLRANRRKVAELDPSFFLLAPRVPLSQDATLQRACYHYIVTGAITTWALGEPWVEAAAGSEGLRAERSG